MEKLIKLILLILISLFVFCTKVNAYSIKVEEVKTSPAGTEIKVTSENKVKQLIMYKKVGDKYVKFFVSNEGNFTEKAFFIPRSKLSTDEKTEIKIKVIDEKGETADENHTIDKLKPYPSMNPEETAKPTSSPIVIPTKPTTVPTSNVNPTSPDNSRNENPSVDDSGVTSVYLPTKTVSMEVGEECQLTPIISPSYAKTTLKWSSNNTKVATVDSKGKIKAVGKGSAVIKVQSGNGLSAICVVTVKEATKNNSNNNGNNTSDQNNNNNKLDFSYKGNGKVKAQFTSANLKIIENHLYDFNNNNFREVIAKHGNFTNYTKSVGGIFEQYYGKTMPAKRSYDVQMASEYVWGWMYMYGFDYRSGEGVYWMWGNGTSHSDDAFYPGNSKCHETSNRLGNYDRTLAGELDGSTKLIITTECGLTVDYLYYKIGVDRNKMVGNNTVKYIPKLRDLQPGDKINFFDHPITNKTPANISERGQAWQKGTHVAMVGEVYDDKIVIYDGGSYYMRNRDYKRTIKRPKNDAEEYESVLGYNGWSAERFITLSD